MRASRPAFDSSGPDLFIIISMHPLPRGSQGPHAGIQKALTIKSLPNRGGISDFGLVTAKLKAKPDFGFAAPAHPVEPPQHQGHQEVTTQATMAIAIGIAIAIAIELIAAYRRIRYR